MPDLFVILHCDIGRDSSSSSRNNLPILKHFSFDYNLKLIFAFPNCSNHYEDDNSTRRNKFWRIAVNHTLKRLYSNPWFQFEFEFSLGLWGAKNCSESFRIAQNLISSVRCLRTPLSHQGDKLTNQGIMRLWPRIMVNGRRRLWLQLQKW